MIKFVYVIGVGERGEGHDPVSAWSTLDEARKAVQRNWNVYPTHVGGVLWRATLNGGVDQIEVRRLRLQGGAR